MPSTLVPRLQATALNSTMTTSSYLGASKPPDDNQNADEYHLVLLAINAVVLLSGIINLSLMMHIMKSSTASVTSIAVLNLMFTHFIFLLTVPFRIYYYATSDWRLGQGWCKVVSSMIHVHMYMSFIFYVVILITRLMTFYCKPARSASFQKIHAFILSALVWAVVIVAVPCIIHFSYGQREKENAVGKSNSTAICFKFGEEIESTVKIFNYIISMVIIMVATVLAVLQANVLRVLYRKHRHGCTSQQDFGAQLKSMVFALIMVVCFIPYHFFRMYYLEHIHLQSINEVFLSLTTFTCLDMFTFLGKRTCYVCFQGNGI